MSADITDVGAPPPIDLGEDPGTPAPDRKWSWLALRPALPVVGLVIGVLSLRATDVAGIGDYGLIQALPVGYFVGLAIVLAAFPLMWWARDARWYEFPVAITAQIVLLHGAPAIAEPLPRFPSAWVIAGFTQFIQDHGQTLPLVDARFNWPSMMAGIGMLGRVGGLPATTLLITWWPVFIALACLPAIYVLARIFTRDANRALLAVWLFPLANWVGQDYFSPQSVAFLLYVTMLVVVVGPFGARERWFWRPAAAGTADRDATSAPATRPRQVAIVLGAMLILTIALATGHQLTPIFAAISVLALSLAGRTSLRVFVAIMATITLAWICWGAFAFWAGHIDKVFGGLGEVGANVSATATSRVVGSAAHRWVTRIRLLDAAFIWGLAAVGFFMSRRLRSDRVGAGIAMVAPFAVLAVQSYGGEGGLRVLLMSLPGALCLIALLLTARPHDAAAASPFEPRAAHAVAVFALTAVMLPVFLIARWGNESYEYTRPNELAAVQALYGMAPAGSTLVAMDLHVPWMAQGVDVYDFKSSGFDNFAKSDIPAIENEFNGASNGFLLITTGQIEFGEQTYGLQPDWASQLESSLTASGDFKLVYHNADARIYRYEGTT